MVPGRAERTILNGLANAAAFVWPILLYVVTIRVIVGRLGAEAYGLIALVLATVSFFGFLDLGLSSAAVKYIAEFAAQKRPGEINQVVGSLETVYLLGSAAGAICLACLTPWLVTGLLKIPPHLQAAAFFCFYAAAGGMVLTMTLGLFSSIPRALQRYDLVLWVTLGVSTLASTLMIILVWWGYGVRALIVGNLAINAGALLLFVRLSLKVLPGLSLRPAFDRQIIRELLSFSVFLLSTQVTGTLLFQFDRMAIGTFLGAAAVTYYAVPASLAMKVHGLVSSIANVLFPLSSEMSAQRDAGQLRELYLRATKYTVAVSLAVSAPLFVFSGPILRFWLGEGFAAQSSGVMRVVVVGYFLVALSAVPFYIFSGMGHVRIVAVYSLISAALNITGCLLLIPRWGLLGAALAVIVGSLQVPFFIRRLERMLGLRAWEVCKRIYLRPAAAAVVPVAMGFLVLPVVTSGFRLLCVAAACVLAFGWALILAGYLDERDRALLRRLAPARLCRGGTAGLEDFIRNSRRAE